MKRHLWTLALASLIAACGATATETESLPEWLSELIAGLEAQPVANPPAFIARRVHETGVFYYLPPRCCDIFSVLFDSDGAIVCHPDGGITGSGDGQCPVLGELLGQDIVWRDSRGSP